MAKTRILRAYSGVRPLVASDDDPSGRNVSRGIVLFDHAERDGLDGFITITGGKLMTYRLMAEWATDAVCRKLGNTRPCITADTPLPGSKEVYGTYAETHYLASRAATRIGGLSAWRSHAGVAERRPPTP
ncbi:anaerobic glycerol-3-phosphate dehydrogenase subunit A [Salmonella enterica subsp. enterica]|uniref:Anaerobic glycerol-3-phosphate dehydrogenase subunit A n=1 Tax=Salmonella enterica I TaxID=59201 RepID=A0A3S4F2J7_SALET|nr:anaerobic glycerol-3-phosphate dehydrogenase subunit A [Salmonella enterica subsp. enterica]